MTEIEAILAAAANRNSCLISPSTGLKVIEDNLSLPADVVDFYERCGGLVINKDATRGGYARIVTPGEFKRIDDVILGERFATGPFKFWYAIADVREGNYLAIDLSEEHKGKCMDAFHETFNSPGYVKVVASSFTDLLRRLLNHPEDSAYWLHDNFVASEEAFAMHGYEKLT